jgi:hypothetical protein
VVEGELEGREVAADQHRHQNNGRQHDSRCGDVGSV